jgi:hypothetical protein
MKRGTVKRLAAAGFTALTLGTTALSMAAPLAGAAPAVPAAHAVLADINGQPDPEGSISPDIIAKLLCQSSSPNNCLAANSGQIISVSSGGTALKWHGNGNTYTTGGITYNTGTLNMPSQSPACLGVNGFGNVTLQNCTTGTGIIWLAGLSNGHHVYGNRYEIQQRGNFQALATSGSDGGVAFVASYPPANGVYERYDYQS